MLVGIHQNFYDMLFTQSCPCFLKSFLFQHYNKPSRQGDICSCGGPLYAYYVTSMYFSLHECVSPASTLNWVRRGSRKHPITFSIIECVFSYRRVHEKKKKHRLTEPGHVLISASVRPRCLFCGSLPSAGGELLRHTDQLLFCPPTKISSWNNAAVKHRGKLQIQPDIINMVCISTDISYLYLCKIHGCRWITPLPLRHNSYQSLVLKVS